MKKTMIAAFGGVLASGFLTVLTPVAHSDTGNFKIVVNGQDITPSIKAFAAGYSGSVDYTAQSCKNLAQNLAQSSGTSVSADINNNAVVRYGKVVGVHLTDEGGVVSGRHWAYETEPPYPAPGDATITHTSSGYKITGHVTAKEPGLVPFEWDLTCS